MKKMTKCKNLLKNIEFLRAYRVDDLISNSCEILFVLESPHKDELIHKHPLAGSSGLKMTKLMQEVDETLFKEIASECDKNLPFGCIVKKALGNTQGFEQFKKFGIMNTCQIPMQKKAYSCEYSSCEIINDLETIKNNISKKKNHLRNKITSCLEKRIMDINIKRRNPKKSLIIIPLGNLADNFLIPFKNDNTLKIKKKLTHPAANFSKKISNNWIERMKQYIKKENSCGQKSSCLREKKLGFEK
jgi:hypothetical protein